MSKKSPHLGTCSWGIAACKRCRPESTAPCSLSAHSLIGASKHRAPHKLCAFFRFQVNHIKQASSKRHTNKNIRQDCGSPNLCGSLNLSLVVEPPLTSPKLDYYATPRPIGHQEVGCHLVWQLVDCVRLSTSERHRIERRGTGARIGSFTAGEAVDVAVLAPRARKLRHKIGVMSASEWGPN